MGFAASRPARLLLTTWPRCMGQRSATRRRVGTPQQATECQSFTGDERRAQSWGNEPRTSHQLVPLCTRACPKRAFRLLDRLRTFRNLCPEGFPRQSPQVPCLIDPCRPRTRCSDLRQHLCGERQHEPVTGMCLLLLLASWPFSSGRAPSSCSLLSLLLSFQVGAEALPPAERPTPRLAHTLFPTTIIASRIIVQTAHGRQR